MDQCTYCTNIRSLDPESSRQPCSSSNGPCNACKTLDDLNEQVQQAQVLLADLLHRRLEAKVAINKTHPSIVHRMPLEVASCIFEIYVEDRSPLKLGAICRTWRQIAWSNPRLWTSLKMNVAFPLSAARFKVAQEWLARSGRLPLSITLDDISSWRRDIEDYAHIIPMIELIKQYSSRWQYLKLELPLPLLEEINDGAAEPTALHTISLAVPDFHRDDGDDISINITRGAPKVVELTGIPLGSLTMQWAAVTTVHTTDLCLPEVKQLLRLAPALQEARFSHIQCRSTSFFGSDDQPLVHSHLTDLDVSFTTGEDEDIDTVSFFDALTFPKLARFLCEFSWEGIPESVLANFIKRSSCPLEELSLEGCYFTDDGLIEITENIPTLTTLRLTVPNNHPPLPGFFDAFERHLENTDDPTAKAQEPLLPRLEKFTWNGSSTFPWDNFIAMFSGPAGVDGETNRLRPLKDLNVSCYVGKDWSIPYIDSDTLNDLVNVLNRVDYDFGLSHSGRRDDWMELSWEKVKADQDAEYYGSKTS